VGSVVKDKIVDIFQIFAEIVVIADTRIIILVKGYRCIMPCSARYCLDMPTYSILIRIEN